MKCRHVRHRLVAWQDGELSPGEATQVEEHLARCADCRTQERRLAAVTPQARLLVPADVQARLHARVSGPIVRGLAAERPATSTSSWHRWLGWLWRDAEIPFGAILAYGMLLVGALGWGVSNWWTVETLEARLAAHEDRIVPTAAVRPPVQIPAEQYRPVAWTPEEDSGYH